MSSIKRRRRRRKKQLRLHYSFQTARLSPRWAFDSYVLLRGKRLDQTDLAGSWVNTLTQTQWHLGCARKLLFLRKEKKKKKEGGGKKKKTHASQDDEIFSAPVWKRIFKDKWHQKKQNNPTLAGLLSPGKSLGGCSKIHAMQKINFVRKYLLSEGVAVAGRLINNCLIMNTTITFIWNCVVGGPVHNWLGHFC